MYSLLVCQSVCLYPINVNTAEPIEPNIFEATHMTPGKFENDEKQDFAEFEAKILNRKEDPKHLK